MLTPRNISVLLLFGLSLVLGTSEPLKAQETAVSFLRIVNSPRANGMGGCVVTMVSEESAYYNPASIGLLHLDKAVSFVVPHSTKWFPEMADDIRLKSWSVSVGASQRLFEKSATGQENISLGFAYSHTALNYGTFLRTSEHGDTLGLFESYDAVKCLAIGFGWQRKVRIGFGYAIKFIDSRLAPQGAGAEAGSGSADGTAHQFGLMVELPIHELTADDEPHNDASAGRTETKITPTFACVFDNLGKDMRYIDADQSDKLPKMSRVGLSVLVAVDSAGREYYSFRGSVEWEKLLVGNSPDQAKAGLEVGVLRTLFGRIGLLGFDEASERLTTYGLGFRLRGFLDAVFQDNAADEDRDFGAYFARHIDFAVDYAKYGSRDGNDLSKTWFYAISVSL